MDTSTTDVMLSGYGVGLGVVIGTACLYEAGDVHVPEHKISASRVESEKSVLEKRSRRLNLS